MAPGSRPTLYAPLFPCPPSGPEPGPLSLSGERDPPEHHRAAPRLARDLERPADRVEAVDHALYPRPVAGRDRIKPPAVVGDLELEPAVPFPQPDDRGRRIRVLRDVLERLERTEVHGRLDLPRVAADPVGIDRRWDR